MVSVKEGIDKKVKQNHSHNLSRCIKIKIKSQIKDKIINSSLRVMRNPCLKECGVSNIVWIYFKEKNVDNLYFCIILGAYAYMTTPEPTRQ